MKTFSFRHRVSLSLLLSVSALATLITLASPTALATATPQTCDRTPCERLPGGVTPPALAGKTWVLHAWAAWCPYCRLDHLRLVELDRAQRARLVSLVHQDTTDKATAYLATHDNPYGGGSLKSSRELIASLGLHSVPATYIIGPNGEILQRFQGALGSSGEEALKQYLAK